MAQYSYSAGYQGGGPSSVPSGYIEAYAQAGRNLGQGVQAIGNVIGESLQRYGQNKEENQFLTARLESLAPYLNTVAQSGNIMDKNSAESKLLGDIEKFSSMSIPQKKATLLNAEFFLDRADKQRARELSDEATRQQLQLGALQLGKAQREAEGAPMLSEAIGAVAAMQPGQAPTMPFANVTQEMIARYGGRLTPEQMITFRAALRDQETESRRRLNEQAMTQVAQLPATQEVTVPAPPAIISSSLNIPAEQQPYTPFYQVQQVMGGQQQQPDVAAFAQGLGRPVTRIPQRIPIADQPLTAAPAPAPQPLVSTQRVPLRDRQVLQQQQAARPVGITPIPQREVPAFESQPIQRTVTETQPVNYQDRFKQAVDVFQRLGAPINPDAIRSVLEATGTPRPIQVDTQTLPGGITVVRADGKVDILPAPKMVEGKDLTEGQSNSLGFASRMMLNEGTINDVVSRGYRPGGLTEFGFTPERLRSDDRKTYDAAKENWIAAALRKESGAAIGKDEYSAADRQYFPQPGDSDKVLKQKATLRSTVFKSMKAGIGRFADDYLRQMGVGQETQPQGGVRKYNPVTKRIE
jgi:hypothetical protein